jgi:hypothetical protein
MLHHSISQEIYILMVEKIMLEVYLTSIIFIQEWGAMGVGVAIIDQYLRIMRPIHL